MKLVDKIRNRSSSRPFYTFEFFPPRTDEGFTNLLARISRLSELEPLAVSVTWGAGGTTKERSLDLASITQSEYGIDTILHLTCTNMELGSVDAALRKAKALGIENILALRGDPPRGEEYWLPTDSRFQHAIDLVSYIKSSPEFSSSFSVGVAAYPDGHADHEMDAETELDHLKAKVDAGADFIITQLFYDVDGFLDWLKRVRERGMDVPVIPGIMPLQSYASFHRLTKLCGTKVPPQLALELDPIRHDDQQVKDFGVELATKMIRRLITEGDIKGVHFCTLNLERSIRKILEGLQWIGGHLLTNNRLIVDTASVHEIHVPPDGNDLLVSTIDASQTAASKLNIAQQVSETLEPGKGEVNNAATWDEFPNGRFGDYKSPAFGTQSDPWNSGLAVSRSATISQWGQPASVNDLTQLFLAHLHAQFTSTPFSPSPLSAESLLILRHLERLTSRGWWTVFSQPAVDGALSSDEVFGWGPSGGYVFQKGFVEFFAERGDVEAIEKKIKLYGGGWVDFFAGNANGEMKTNVLPGGRNAVTWGVFPGHEIAQSTIIEMDSFLSWKEEAFSIWEQWSLFYPPDSKQRIFLESIRRERWLISIVHHDFKEQEKLWSFILEE